MSRGSFVREFLEIEWCQVNTRMGQTFIASLLSDIIIDARSAVRMAVCSYCQRINALRPVKAVVVDGSKLKSWSSSFSQYCYLTDAFHRTRNAELFFEWYNVAI
jgi:hypothetical protein